MASYRQALAALLSDDRKSEIVRRLAKSEQTFRGLRDAAVYQHNQSLTRALRALEGLGLVQHTYRHGSPEVYSFYSLTSIGRDVLGMLRGLDEYAVRESALGRRRIVRKVLRSASKATRG